MPSWSEKTLILDSLLAPSTLYSGIYNPGESITYINSLEPLVSFVPVVSILLPNQSARDILGFLQDNRHMFGTLVFHTDLATMARGSCSDVSLECSVMSMEMWNCIVTCAPEGYSILRKRGGSMSAEVFCS